jgi:hypothetical protein
MCDPASFPPPFQTLLNNGAKTLKSLFGVSCPVFRTDDNFCEPISEQQKMSSLKSFAFFYLANKIANLLVVSLWKANEKFAKS